MVSVYVLVMTIVSTAAARSLLERAPQSQAVCLPDYAWTDNSKQVSPCQLAAVILQSCAGSSFTVTTINATNHYNPPSAANNTANLCSCSWAAYNLLNACATCQGFSQSIQNWAFWKTDCGDKLSNTYFPTQLALPEGTLIPFYATTDPTTWTDQRFNINDAKTKAESGHADLTPTETIQSGKSKAPVGAIVGGVIGGLVALALAGVVAFFMLRKKKQSGQTAKVTGLAYADPPGHARNMSDFSQKSNGIGIGYQRMDRSFVTTPTTHGPVSPGTMHTHTSSVNSLSYFGSINHSAAPYGSPPTSPGRTFSPPPTSPFSPPPQHQQGMNREDIIVPYTLAPSPDSMQRQGSNANLTDRKRADGAIIPVYDSPNSPPSPVFTTEGSSNMNISSRRGRVNPPTYSEASQAPERSVRPAHTKKGSADTNHSDHSGQSGNTIRHGSPVSGGGSISAIDDVIGQMGFGPPETVSGSGGTLATGLSGQVPRSQVFRPTNATPSP